MPGEIKKKKRSRLGSDYKPLMDSLPSPSGMDNSGFDPRSPGSDSAEQTAGPLKYSKFGGSLKKAKKSIGKRSSDGHASLKNGGKTKKKELKLGRTSEPVMAKNGKNYENSEKNPENPEKEPEVKSSPVRDERFAHIRFDPKFRKLPSSERKVIVDKRFAGMFTDERFTLKSTVDKRGRPLVKHSNDNLKSYYSLEKTPFLESDGEAENAGETPDLAGTSTSKGLLQDPDSESDNDAKILQDFPRVGGSADGLSADGRKLAVSTNTPAYSDSDSESDGGIKIRLDLARGEGNLESSDANSDDEWEFEVEEGMEHAWAELDKDAPRREDATHRLAVCNMDWDKIKAQDLFILLSSFKPTMGTIHSVTVYPSEFGKERIAQEEARGPAELIETEEIDDFDNIEDIEKERSIIEKLRSYQINRLKYYYAVVICDTPETASAIYESCDGLEYELSGTRLDLRFIPTETNFDDDVPRDKADSLEDVELYKPNLFVSSALKQATVRLTWDETDPKRTQTLKDAFDEEKLEDMDFKDMIASDSSEDEEEARQRDAVEKYRTMLLGDADSGDDVDMEVTWDPEKEPFPSTSAEPKPDPQRAESSESELESEPKPKGFQKYLQRRKEKRRERTENRKRAKVDSRKLNEAFEDEDGESAPIPDEVMDQSGHDEALNLLVEDDDDRKHFDFKKIMKEGKKGKKKRKKETKPEAAAPDADFDVNVEDPRFASLFTAPAFSIDPSDPNFKETPGIKKIIDKKLKSIVARKSTEIREEPLVEKLKRKSLKIRKLTKKPMKE